MGTVFSGTDSAEEAMSRARRRAESMGAYQLAEWMSAALPGMQRHFEAYQRTHDVSHLGELMLAHMNTGIVLDEMMRRASEGK